VLSGIFIIPVHATGTAAGGKRVISRPYRRYDYAAVIRGKLHLLSITNVHGTLRRTG